MIDSILGKPGNCQYYTPVERAVLFSVGKLLDEPFATIYREQLSLPNEVQRLSNGKECNFYIKKFFQVSKWPEDLALPNIAREYLLGMVTLQHRDSKAEAHARVYVVHGHVFSVSFDKPPSFLNQNFKVTEAVLVNKPDAKEIALPLPVGTAFPSEYLELVRGGYSSIGEWQLVPERDIAEFVLDEVNLYLLATHEVTGMVCLRGGDSSGKPVYLEDDDSEEIVIEGSLIEFLNKPSTRA